MDEATRDDLLATIAALREVLEVHAIATRNEYAVRRLVFLTDRIKPVMPHLGETCARIVSLGRCFYSMRRHERSAAGSAGVHAKIRALVNRIEDGVRSMPTT